MDEFDHVVEQLKRFFSKVWVRVILIVCLIFGIGWVLVQSCSRMIQLETKVWKIARDPNFHPLDLHGNEKSMYAFVNELFQVIAKEQGFYVELIPVGAGNLFEGLDYQRYDAVISPLVPNVLNEKKYFFSDPIYKTGSVLVVKTSSKITDIEDLKGKTVGLEFGSPILFYLQIPEVYLRSYQTKYQAFEQLIQDKIDAVILPSLEAYASTTGFFAGKIRVSTPPLTNESLRLIGINDTSSELLLELFNQGLESLKANGRYDSLLEKWRLINPDKVTQDKDPLD